MRLPLRPILVGALIGFGIVLLILAAWWLSPAPLPLMEDGPR